MAKSKWRKSKRELRICLRKTFKGLISTSIMQETSSSNSMICKIVISKSMKTLNARDLQRKKNRSVKSFLESM